MNNPAANEFKISSPKTIDQIQKKALILWKLKTQTLGYKKE